MPKEKGKKPYFGKDVHNAIVQYQSMTGSQARQLYLDIIHPAFQQLSENLYNIYKPKTNREDTIHDTMELLQKSIHKFDSTKGTKAFSYFNMCARNSVFVGIKKKKRYNDKVVLTENWQDEMRGSVPSPESIMIKQESEETIIDDLMSIRPEMNDKCKDIIDAIIFLFENTEEIDLFNKLSLRRYIEQLLPWEDENRIFTRYMLEIKNRVKSLREKRSKK